MIQTRTVPRTRRTHAPVCVTIDARIKKARGKKSAREIKTRDEQSERKRKRNDPRKYLKREIKKIIVATIEYKNEQNEKKNIRTDM